jgi:hypothetical protein
MAYDLELADRIRSRLASHPGVTERQMFGGIGFMVGGNMAVGVTGNELMVRVAAEEHDAAMARPGAHAFGMTGRRPMRGWLVVAPEGIASDSDFGEWVDLGVRQAESLPPK